MIKKELDLSEHITSGNFMRGGFNPRQNTRSLFLPIILAIILGALFIRVFFLQVVKGQYYRNISDSNRTKTVAVHAPRGIIFDRDKIPLTFNIPGFRQNLNGKTIFLDQSQALPLIAKGEYLEVDALRTYPYKDITAHVLGYIGQISEDEIKNPLYSDYKATSVIGKDGIEKIYEQRLAGIDGKELYEVDSAGKTIRKLGKDEPIAGENIDLTLDINLQKKVYDALKDVKKGAAIVTNPKGEILSLVSKPTFDPNLFTQGAGYKTSSESSYFTLSSVLSDSQNQPFLDRAISGVYPPGSTFKIVVASAALKNKIIDSNWQIEDTGIIHVGDFSFANWFYTGYGKTDGQVNVVKGIKRSNDIFFYQLAAKTGIDTISNTAKEFGVGHKLGIDLPAEQGGLLPTVEWKQKNIGEQWYLGDTYHYGIGQGYLLTTPLQVNAWTQAIANEGILYRPHLLKENPLVLSSDLLDKTSFDLIRQGMIEACEPGGVAWPFFNFKVKNSHLKIDGRNILEVPISSGSADMRQVVIACKTGTAENGDGKTAPHAWITLFAPAFNPQIVVTVLSENSGEGSNIAAPIAKKILDYYFGE